VPYGVVGRRVLRAAASVIALSRSEADMVAERVRAVRPVVIPSGIDVCRLRSAEVKEKASPVVLSVGRLVGYKGVARVVEALPLFGDANLVVIGSGPEAATIRRLADSRGLREKVQLVGAVDDDELARWYATADVVISLSSYESFGMVVLEGLAAGTRVVASDIPAHRDMRQFDEHGALRLVPFASSPQEIARAVRAELAIGRCTPSASVLSWEAVAQLHVSVLASRQLGSSSPGLGRSTSIALGRRSYASFSMCSSNWRLGVRGLCSRGTEDASTSRLLRKVRNGAASDVCPARCKHRDRSGARGSPPAPSSGVPGPCVPGTCLVKPCCATGVP